MYKLKTTVNFPDINIGGTTDHSKLSNLDYDNSGHTGFASKQDLEIKVDKVDGKQLSTEDYTTEEKNKLNSLENYDDTQIKENINEIESKIPSQASNTNQLADKEFVNSSISTNTATFRGTYNTLVELQQQEADINDYGVVISTDSSGNTLYNRYKYTGEEWVFEYSLNNSSFTANQWASINSGITSEKVSKIGENETNISNLETNKVDKITGKGLSENDYTNEEKEKLASLENYTLPIASTDTLGGIKIGENLNIDENGVVSASGGGSSEIIELTGNYAYIGNLETGIYKAPKDFIFRVKESSSTDSITIYSDYGYAIIQKTPDWNDNIMFYIFTGWQKNSSSSRSIVYGNVSKISQTFLKGELYSLGKKKIISGNKDTVIEELKSYTGYDATATQVLKNVNGTLTWISE